LAAGVVPLDCWVEGSYAKSNNTQCPAADKRGMILLGEAADMDTTKCIELAAAYQSSTLTLIGLQEGTKCYGGTEPSTYNYVYVNSTMCNKPCGGNASQNCGGDPCVASLYLIGGWHEGVEGPWSASRGMQCSSSVCTKALVMSWQQSRLKYLSASKLLYMYTVQLYYPDLLGKQFLLCSETQRHLHMQLKMQGHVE